MAMLLPYLHETEGILPRFTKLDVAILVDPVHGRV